MSVIGSSQTPLTKNVLTVCSALFSDCSPGLYGFCTLGPFSLQQVLGWPKSPFSFFHKIKDTFFIFTNNFIDLDSLRVSAVSCYWLLVGRGQGAAKLFLMHKTAPRKDLFGQNINSTKKHRKPLLTHSITISHRTISTHCTNLFLHFSCIFTFLEIIKHSLLKMLGIFFHLQY